MVAEVPGDAVGLGGAVVAAAAASVTDAVPAGAAAPVVGAVQADITTITVPAPSRPSPAGMCIPMTFTGAFLLGVEAESSLQFSQPLGIGLQTWCRRRIRSNSKRVFGSFGAAASFMLIWTHFLFPWNCARVLGYAAGQ